MRWPSLSPLLLALVACGEPSAVRPPPTDRFAFPSAVAVTARASGGTALVVASGNYDLTYDGAGGGTVLAVDPSDWDPGTGRGSAGRPGGALDLLGEGARVGSFTGELVVADAATCPKADTTGQAPEVLLATRFADEIWRLPLTLDGHAGPCPQGCVVPTEAKLHDPFGVALACRPDFSRRSAFVSYLRVALLSGVFETGWLVEVDLDRPATAPRSISLGNAALGGMAYDGEKDRLYVVGRPLLSSPVHVLDLTPCPAGLAACPAPAINTVDLALSLPGLELQSIALSTPQAGRGRRAYVSARVYDPTLASLIGIRPAADIGAVLLVLDLQENASGVPAMTVLDEVPVGMGTGQVLVLPPRPGLRDLVVVSGSADGVLTVYDDEQGEIARAIPMDTTTGAPEVGRAPYGLAAELLPGGTVARVYVAASLQAVVGMVDVPLAQPGQAQVRRAAGAPIRIGGLQ